MFPIVAGPRLTCFVVKPQAPFNSPGHNDVTHCVTNERGIYIRVCGHKTTEFDTHFGSFGLPSQASSALAARPEVAFPGHALHIRPWADVKYAAGTRHKVRHAVKKDTRVGGSWALTNGAYLETLSPFEDPFHTLYAPYARFELLGRSLGSWSLG